MDPYADAEYRLRKKLLVSQTAMARMLGVSFASVNRWENEQNVPTLSAKMKIRALCKKHDIQIDAHE